MKTSSLIFNAAAIVTLLGIFVALVDLMKHKTKSYGVTSEPTTATPAPSTPAPLK